MIKAKITGIIVLLTFLVLMQTVIINAQKAELVVQTGHSEPITSVVLSNDGKLILTGGWDKAVKLWEVQTGKELRTFAAPEPLSPISAIALSPDDRTLATTHTGSKDGFITLWDMQTGRLIRKLRGHSSFIDSVVFSPDGKLLASASDDRSVRIWDGQTGQAIHVLKGHTDRILSVAFSPDGKTLASGGMDGTVRVWDVRAGGGQSVSLPADDKGEVSTVAFSRDGAILASGGSDKMIRMWDVRSGNELRRLSGHTKYIAEILFLPDGRSVVSGSGDDTVIWWDIESGKEIRRYSAADFFERSRLGGIMFKGFSPDGELVAWSSENNLELIDLQTGRKVSSLASHVAYSGNRVAFSPDGQTLASGRSDRTIKLWNLQTGNGFRTLKGHTEPVSSVVFSPDGKLLASSQSDTDHRVILWDVGTGTILRTFPGQAEAWAFTPDGTGLVTLDLAASSRNLVVCLWDVKTGAKQRNYELSDEAYTGEIMTVVPDLAKYDEDVPRLSPDGRFQAGTDKDKQIHLFDIGSGKRQVSLIALDEEDWVVVDPEGRFDASPGALKLMHFVVGLEAIDLEQIKDRYYTPNLLQRIFKGENLEATRKVSVFTADELYPLAEFPPLKPHETSLTVRLKNRGGGIGVVQVFVNGTEFLADARPKGFDPKSQAAEIKVDFSRSKALRRGEPNEIKIIARNEAGWLRSRGTEVVYLDDGQKDAAPPEFYAVIGGVSDYENPAFNLRYSAKDARDFARAVELGAARLFGADKVHIRLLASGGEKENAVLTGKDSKNLTPSKENFRRVFEEFRRAKPTDVLMVYLSGHGTSVNRGGDTGDIYLFLTQEAVTTDKTRLLDEKLRDATTVSSDELAEWIRDIPALKRAMILDTCAAGAVEASLLKPRDLSPDQIKALDRMKDRTGFFVLMGSAADAQSYEATRYGQGLLTYSLLQAMSGARLREGEYADISLLFNYAEDAVIELAKGIGGIQQPRVIAPVTSRSFDIGRFSSAEKSRFTLAKVKPLILQPQLSNDKLKFDNLKLSQSVAKALRDESSTVSRDGRGESQVVFVEAEEMNDAITPGGVYEVSGEQVKVTLVLVRNNEAVKTVTVEGSTTDKEDLSRKIVRAIIENASD